MFLVHVVELGLETSPLDLEARFEESILTVRMCPRRCAPRINLSVVSRRRKAMSKSGVFGTAMSGTDYGHDLEHTAND